MIGVKAKGYARKRPARSQSILARSSPTTAGDVVIASGTLSYLGPFTSEYRTRIADSWVEVICIFSCAQIDLRKARERELATLDGKIDEQREC